MLSESQERMLIGPAPRKRGEAKAVFRTNGIWTLPSFGETIAEDSFLDHGQ